MVIGVCDNKNSQFRSQTIHGCTEIRFYAVSTFTEDILFTGHENLFSSEITVE